MQCGSDIGKRCMAAELDRKGSEGLSPDINPKPRNYKLLSSLVPTRKIGMFHIKIIVLIPATDDSGMQTAEFPLEVSKPLKLIILGHNDCTEWLSSIKETLALISAILSIHYPSCTLSYGLGRSIGTG